MVTAASGEPIGYAICTDARSGSTFLTHVLRSTQVLGNPFEFFNPSVDEIVPRGSPDRLETLRRRASTANGVYGLKVFPHQFDLAVDVRWAERLPRLHYVELRREDLLAQAISLARATQTGRYKTSDGGSERVRYDRAAIARCLARIAYGHARWDSWFARNGIVPLRLTYEGIVESPQDAAEAIASLLQLDVRPCVDLAAVEVSIQRDATSEEWRRRFIEDSAEPGYLDGGRLFSRFREGARFARWFLGPR